jgi:S-adenosylmethionine:diacylglycerol 3-amino-3-carboxypropyl transferase
VAATDSFQRRAAFDRVRYANCWEDADILCEALQPQPGSRILSIASAGDNVLAVLYGYSDLNPFTAIGFTGDTLDMFSVKLQLYKGHQVHLLHFCGERCLHGRSDRLVAAALRAGV